MNIVRRPNRQRVIASEKTTCAKDPIDPGSASTKTKSTTRQNGVAAATKRPGMATETGSFGSDEAERYHGVANGKGRSIPQEVQDFRKTGGLDGAGGNRLAARARAGYMNGKARTILAISARPMGVRHAERTG